MAARALQGVFAALLAPAALSLLATTFTEPAERGKAFGIFAAIAGMGGAIGLLLGGALTEALDWRYCLYVSIAFAVPAAIAGTRLLHHVPAPARPRLDIPGTLTASSGLFALVFGLSRAVTDGWGDPVTIGLLVGSAVLLATFVAIQQRVAHPLLPLRVVADRNRGASFLAIATASAGLFGLFLFLTFYLQNTKGLTALETGLAFLPLSFSIAPTVGIVSTRVLPRTGRAAVTAGLLPAALGMALLTRIGVDTAYASHVLPSLILIGVGFGLTLAPSFATATSGVPAHDAGVASAMVNTSLAMSYEMESVVALTRAGRHIPPASARSIRSGAGRPLQRRPSRCPIVGEVARGAAELLAARGKPRWFPVRVTVGNSTAAAAGGALVSRRRGRYPDAAPDRQASASASALRWAGRAARSARARRR